MTKEQQGQEFEILHTNACHGRLTPAILPRDQRPPNYPCPETCAVRITTLPAPSWGAVTIAR